MPNHDDNKTSIRRGWTRRSMSRYRVTVDTGGTFSDFVYLNEDTGEVSISKVPSTPDDPSRAILQGVETLLGQGVAPDDISFFCHGTTVGTNALLEGKGVRTGLLVTEGFRAHLSGRRAGAALRRADLRRDVRQAAAAGAAEPHRRGARARRFPRQRAASRSTRRRCARPCASSRREKIESLAVCLLFSFLHPAARGARARDRRRGDAGLQHLAVVRDRAADPRVLPAEHDRHQRLPAADPGALHRAARAPPQRGRPDHAAEIHHAVERRHGDLRRRRAQGGDHRAVRPGRRRHRRRLCLPDDRLPEHHHLRHGRHLLRRRADQGRRALDRQPRQDRRPRPRGADDGHQHRERGRRHHRQRRPLRRAQGRPGKRRRDAGPGLLLARRRHADDHRLQSRARPPERGQFPRRPDAARLRRGAPGGREQGGEAARHGRRRGRRRHRAHHRREDGGGDQGDLHHARPRPARLHAARLRRRRAGARRADRPRPRHGRHDRAALSRRLFGDRPDHVRRQARLHPVAHDAAAAS